MAEHGHGWIIRGMMRKLQVSGEIGFMKQWYFKDSKTDETFCESITINNNRMQIREWERYEFDEWLEQMARNLREAMLQTSVRFWSRFFNN